MGGAAPTPSGKGGKKQLDASINLVPFIDLLSCCISFLIITAVWTQLARMNVTQKGPASAGTVENTDEKTVQLAVLINKDGYSFTKSTGENTDIPLKGEDYDYAKLADVLKDAKAAYPDKNDVQVKAVDSVIYQKVVKTMDIVLSAHFPDVSLGDQGGGV
ncbi:MAG: biopolymer transporter ExbD [Polyangia bacterium]